MRAPIELGFLENPFSQQGVPPTRYVPFSAYPGTFFHRINLEKWLSNIYTEKRPLCYILVGDYGSGKSHVKNNIKLRASQLGYEIKEVNFDTTTSLFSTILSTNYSENRTLILFDEVQALYRLGIIAQSSRHIRDLDEVPDGASYAKILANALLSGQLDLESTVREVIENVLKDIAVPR